MTDNIDFFEEPYTLIDEEGEEAPFEMLDTLIYEGVRYFAMTPILDDDDESEEGEIIILRSEKDGEEEVLVTFDDEDLYDKIGNMFLERINAEYGDEEE
jgi:uncharacterized protein YrzB (UPF0473 family)